MNDNDRVLEELRERIESEHRAAVEALEVLAKYLGSNGAVRLENKPQTGSDQRRGIQSGSGRDAISKAIKDKFHTVEEIAAATGLGESQVRGALYSQDFVKKIQSKRIKGGRVRFRMRAEEEAEK